MEDKDKNRVRVQVVEESAENKSKEEKHDEHHEDHDDKSENEEHHEHQEHENQKDEVDNNDDEEKKDSLKKYSVQILNGSGIAGEAGRVEKLLNTAGFTNTKTGNAQSYDFQETEVAVKKGDPDILFNNVEKALSSYKITKIDPLNESSSFDIIITVGKSK